MFEKAGQNKTLDIEKTEEKINQFIKQLRRLKNGESKPRSTASSGPV